MTTKELIELMQTCNPEAEVIVFNTNTGLEYKVKDADGDSGSTRIEVAKFI